MISKNKHSGTVVDYGQDQISDVGIRLNHLVQSKKFKDGANSGHFSPLDSYLIHLLNQDKIPTILLYS